MVDVFHCFSVKWTPADTEKPGPLCCTAAPRCQKAVAWHCHYPRGPVHTSLATEYPLATHGRDTVPRWLNKIALKIGGEMEHRFLMNIHQWDTIISRRLPFLIPFREELYQIALMSTWKHTTISSKKKKKPSGSVWPNSKINIFLIHLYLRLQVSEFWALRKYKIDFYGFKSNGFVFGWQDVDYFQPILYRWHAIQCFMASAHQMVNMDLTSVSDFEDSYWIRH